VGFKLILLRCSLCAEGWFETTTKENRVFKSKQEGTKKKEFLFSFFF